MKRQHLALVVTIVLGATGCHGPQNRRVLRHSCTSCQHRPICACTRLRAAYCVQCQRPLDGRADRSRGDRYAELDDLIDRLAAEHQAIGERHPTADEDYQSANRLYRICHEMRRWVHAEERAAEYEAAVTK